MAAGRKRKKQAQRLWRPDFRDAQSLPDTKVIRTGFLLNFLAIALALLVVSIFMVREYSLRSLKSEMRTLETEVDAHFSQNQEILANNKRFREAANVVGEVVDFSRTAVDYTGFVSEFSRLVPESMLISRIEMAYLDAAGKQDTIPPFTISLTGRITGETEETPSQILTDLQDDLAEIPSLKGKPVELDLTRFNRNNEFGHFDFTLQVRINPGSGGPS